MPYLSTPFRFRWLLLPVLILFSTPANAEDKLALTFELPAVRVPVESLVRQQESLPPITPSASKRADMALQFAQNELAMPMTSSQPQVEKAGTVAEAFTPDRVAEDLLAADPKNEPSWLSTSEMVKSIQQRLNHSAKDEAAVNADSWLEANILEDWIYDGGSDSLVARTVGSAEGTRSYNGQRTTAYYGHTDPGNGVWNLGTFSYQHEAVSPEDADEKQLRRLQRQERQLKEKALQWQVPLSMEVRLNGLDLANQAPLAALDKGGYIERLAEAYQRGKSGEEAIVWARTHAYFDPDRQDWDAPGLGNNQSSIQRDQARRMAAIDRTLRAYKAESTGRTESLQEVTIASDRIIPKDPLLDRSKSLPSIEFSLDLVPTTEQANLEPSSAPVIFEVDAEEVDAEETGSEQAIAQDDDAVFASAEDRQAIAPTEAEALSESERQEKLDRLVKGAKPAESLDGNRQFL